MATPEEQRRYQREWLAKRRADWLADKKCVHCGSHENLQVDHRDFRTKRRPFDHAVWSWSEERRNAELAKCQVLCKPCHYQKTLKEGSRGHGERMSNAKLTESGVREIRMRTTKGEAKRALAREYGVSEKLIRLVCKGEMWKHVGSDPDG